MLTKQLKTDWLNALKSGKYKKGTGKLKITGNNIVEHCCLGVLAELHPDMSIIDNGRSVIRNNSTTGYHLFRDILGSDIVTQLYSVNDKKENEFDNYTSVIPIIESIPTID